MVGKKGSEKLWAERLSTMRWISLPEGSLATTSWRKRTNCWLVWRLPSACDDLAAPGLEGGTVREILEPMALSASRRKRPHRIEPVECLAGRLLVHAEDSGMGLAGPDRVQ